MSNILLTLFADAFQIELAFCFFSLFYPEKRVSDRILWLCGAVMLILGSLPECLGTSPVTEVLCWLLPAYGCCFLYRGSWKQYLFLPLTAVTGFAVLRGAALLLTGTFSAMPAAAILIGDLLACLVILALRRWKERYVSFPVTYALFPMLIPLLTLLVSIWFIRQPGIPPFEQLVICAALTVINASVFWLVQHLSDYLIAQHQLHQSTEQAKLYHTRLLAMQQSEEKLRRYRHDLNNHLHLLQSQLDTGQYAAAMQHLSAMQREMTHVEKQICSGNPVIDNILTLKFAEAEQQGIDCRYEIAIPEEELFDEFDLCTVLFNLLDNAIEAQQQLDGPKSLFLEMRFKPSILKISVQNPCSPSLCFAGERLPETTKSDPQSHGIGMQNILAVRDKYDGISSFAAKDGSFEATLYLCAPQQT